MARLRVVSGLWLSGLWALLMSAAIVAGPLSVSAHATDAPTQPSATSSSNSPVHPAGTPAERAAAYLVGQLTDGDHYESGGFVQYGTTVDIALGLLATGTEPAAVDAIAAYLNTSEAVGAYTHGVPFDREDAVYAGPTAKLALTAMFGGFDPTDFGGEDLIANLIALETPSGRFSDISDFGDFSNVFGQSFAVLAQTAAAGVQPDGAAVAFLMAAQCGEGGFPIDFPKTAATCDASPDATGLAIQALDAGNPDEGPGELSPDREASLVSAVRSLESTRSAEGWWEAFDAPNINSTGYAAMALIAVGQTADSSIAWLESVQHDDGGLPISPDDPDSNVFATAQALEALGSTSFLTTNTDLLGAVVNVPPANTTPTATPTATPTSTITSTPTPTATLPGTGSGKTVSLISIGVGLAVVGLGLVLLSARLKRRP